uniref:Reverse transcriptase Ty1/copia-type domain-containing protein n=1 Tax=Cannabis sativa TaxID=3483 RepID=A0A803QNZ8_CANSA
MRKCILSKDVTFNESVMGFIDKLARSQANTNQEEIKVPGTELEVEAPGKVETKISVDHKSDDLEDDSRNDNLRSYKLARDRTRREAKAPERYGHADLIAFAFHVANQIVHEEPTSYTQAMKSKDRKKWNGAMTEEIHSLKKNQTWDVILMLEDGKVIGCKWVYKWKEGILGVQEALYKTRLVAKGFSQTEGVDHNEIFSSVVRHRSIRNLLALVAC